jgi:hypothetical protein
VAHIREQIARQGPEAYVASRLPYVTDSLLEAVALTAPVVRGVAGVGDPCAMDSTAAEGYEGRVICAWCKGDLGPFSGQGISHGICAACAEEVRRG